MNNSTADYQPGTLVALRGRDWVVQASPDPDLLLLQPLGGSEEETTGLFLPATTEDDLPVPAEFPTPTVEDLGNFGHARILYNAARLSFRNGAGPFRSLAKLSFRPRSYQMVPLVMALRQDITRLLVADDVGIGKTIEALLIIAELLERKTIERFAVVCLPHLCDQWQQEIRDKIGLEAVVIRSNTQARLDRDIHGDVSVYQHYPFQIISIDYIKSETRRQIFISECPELLIVDEAHTCARPQGASKGQQQRHALLRDIIDARPDKQHLVMLTATPHSGKPEEFTSLLGLIDNSFETIDIATAGQAERKRLAVHFVQRRRADVAKWMNQKTPFPERDSGEFDYNLGSEYATFFENIFSFARGLVSGKEHDRRKRVHYWTALGMLRGVMSSPAAGMSLLRNRRAKLGDEDLLEEIGEELVHDSPEGFTSDLTPAELVEGSEWTDHEKRKLRQFEEELANLQGFTKDNKLEAARMVIADWLDNGFSPVIFCRYIATANYLGEQLKPILTKEYKDIAVEVVTSEDPDELRKERIEAMGKAKRRVLIATDCLSEGINLHQWFDAVLHYDLPWNPNRLEQREGRVDRFGQMREEVKAYLLFSQDNPVDGVVLNVILRKVREIKKATGINVPFPEDSKGVIDAITQSLLLEDHNKVNFRKTGTQMEIHFEEFDTAKKIDLEVTDKFKRSEENVKASRSIFTQYGIKAEDIEPDLRENDLAIGNPEAVRDFLIEALSSLYGAQIEPVTNRRREVLGFQLYLTNLPDICRTILPEPDKRDSLPISFESPTPQGFHYIGRNHSLVEQICQRVLADTMDRQPRGASRAAVFRTRQVEKLTTLLIFRVRNVIEEKHQRGPQLIAEEMLLWGYRGNPRDADYLDFEEARRLLSEATVDGNLERERQERELRNSLQQLSDLRQRFDELAEKRSQHLVEAHERFSRLVDRKKFQVVYPVLPMDVLGTYILVPQR
ncbi:MAG: DEAD/DEAH box helicase [Opitutales bacterium]|nr:DEAD/DEAH box helicase [Opitutales bacterium]